MIKIGKVSASVWGSCNNCSNHLISRVYMIEIALVHNGLSFRLCENCKKELISKLKSANSKPT